MMKLLNCLAVVTCFAGPVAAAERLITVIGTGQVASVPDMAKFDISVQTEAPTASEALRQNSARMQTIQDELRTLGLEARDIQTTRVNVGPVWTDWAPKEGGEPTRKIAGYTSSSSIALTLRDLDAVGGLLDRLVEIGASSVSGPHFGFQDPRPALDEARRAAVRDGRAQAELFAEAAGVRLGSLAAIVPQGNGMIGGGHPVMHMMEAARSVPVAPGELDTRIEVTMQWEILDIQR